MNERFEHLMYQAGMTAQGCWDAMDSYQREAIEKFAQLIVKECAAIADINALQWKLPGSSVKQHFGVDR